MSQNVTAEQIQIARRTDLYAFLLKYHDSGFKHEGDSIRLKSNHSISIRRGYAGYKDFATSETGNSVDFLINYMGYGLVNAVQALTADSINPALSTAAQQPAVNNIPPQFPTPVDGRYKNLFAYLAGRGISTRTIQALVSRKIIYQEKNRNNIVFINFERDFAELHGTYTYGKSFHGVVSNCRHDGFWWFRTSKTAKTAYICEAAIDAISLHELHKMQKNPKDAYYISIAGVAKQAAIDRLKNSLLTPVIAVDNDDVGQKCRERNADLAYILPTRKDWNDDLKALQKK